MSTVTRSRTFVVESFEGSADERVVARARDRLRTACADLRAAGTAVEYLGALFVPQDELILHLFVSPARDGVLDASRRAEIGVERILESVAVGVPPDGALVVPAGPGGVRTRVRPARRG